MAALEREQKAYSEMEEERTVQQPKDTASQVIRREDIRYYVDGRRTAPDTAARVAEDGSYMADFIYGKGGKIEEIHYDRIKPK